MIRERVRIISSARAAGDSLVIIFASFRKHHRGSKQHRATPSRAEGYSLIMNGRKAIQPEHGRRMARERAAGDSLVIIFISLRSTQK